MVLTSLTQRTTTRTNTQRTRTRAPPSQPRNVYRAKKHQTRRTTHTQHTHNTQNHQDGGTGLFLQDVEVYQKHTKTHKRNTQNQSAAQRVRRALKEGDKTLRETLEKKKNNKAPPNQSSPNQTKPWFRLPRIRVLERVLVACVRACVWPTSLVLKVVS